MIFSKDGNFISEVSFVNNIKQKSHVNNPYDSDERVQTI